MTDDADTETEQRPLGARLRSLGLPDEHTAMLAAAEQLVPLGAFLWNAAELTLSASPGLEGIIGAAANTISSPQAALDLVHPDDQTRIRRLVRLASRGNEIEPANFRLVRTDGSMLHVVGSLQAVFDDSGELCAVRGALMDVTERRELESQLLQSQKMEAIGTLAGGVAHDFNNFLQVISGHTDLMRTVPALPPRLQTSIDGIKSAIERCTQLTQRLLAFGRKHESAPTLNDIRTLVRSTTQMLTRLIGDDVQLEISIDPQPCTVRIDPVQFEQVVVNLVVNARDAMPAGGTLLLRVEKVFLDAGATAPYHLLPGRYCRLEVVDTGVGMGEDVRVRIFEPFYTTKPSGSGTGLGLSTVHGIVHQAGGAIRVESQLGSGSRFELLFPADGSGQLEMPVASVSNDFPTGTETILLVEDGEEVRAVTEQQLGAAGYHVLSAANGEAALALLERHQGSVDLLLTDVMMPLMNGPELAGKLEPLRPGLRVVFMSGYTERLVLRRTALRGDRVALQKPFSMRELLHCVRASLDATTV